ncbi:MAG: (Fe-S)-binding protein [candidate division KSB1 bacterium]|nr:(Fe-S)-binding protein [candidate division KSB1 bacterium]
MSESPLRWVYDEASRCNRCGYCQPTCPTFSLTHVERNVARGRNNLVRAVYEGRMPLNRDVKSAIFGCLMCAACVSNCHPEVRTDHIVAAARAAYYEHFGRPAIQQVIFERLLPNPGALGRLLSLARLGKNSGLSGLARVLRILGWYGKSIATAEALVPRIPRRFLREVVRVESPSSSQQKPRVAYFVGCAINFALPHVGSATLRVLQDAKCTVTLLDNLCCGLPPYAYGDIESAQKLARHNLDVMAKVDADVVISECASCVSFLKEYPHLLSGDAPYEELAHTIAARVQDATQFLRTLPMKPTPEAERISVTYHDPCHLSHHLRERNAPRQLLRSLPGVDFVELPESDWCCGGAGSYNITHPDVSEAILARKMANVARTGAQVLTTACPSCLMQLSYGVRRHKLNVRVMHVVELVAAKTMGQSNGPEVPACVSTQ